jgi:hypothetical protein
MIANKNEIGNRIMIDGKKVYQWLNLYLLFTTCILYSNQTDTPMCRSIPVNMSKDPKIEISIEGHTYSLHIDTGAAIAINLQDYILEDIKNKEIKEGITYFDDFRDRRYSSKCSFLIPQLKIGSFLFENIIAKVENKDFLINCDIIPPGFENENPSSSLDGRIGLNFFRPYCCLFKFSDSVIYLAEDISGLKHQMSMKDYVEIPMETDSSGLIILKVELDMGVKTFTLDSGSSGAIFRESLIDDKEALLKKNLTKEAWPGMWLFRSKKLKIGGVDFGNQNFWLVELGKCWDDGLLGVDFFNKHGICLDFQNKKVYIEKPKRTFWQKIFSKYTETT